MSSKKSKAKSKVVDCCAPACVDDYRPRIYLDLEGADVKQIKGLKVGEQGQVLISGKVVGLEERTRTDEKGKEKKTASIQIEGYDVEVLGDEDNVYTELSKED